LGLIFPPVGTILLPSNNETGAEMSNTTALALILWVGLLLGHLATVPLGLATLGGAIDSAIDQGIALAFFVFISTRGA